MSKASFDPPSFPLSGTQLDALELITSGMVHPIDGYRLPGDRDSDWPFDSTLVVPRAIGALASAAGSLVLTDPDRTPLATLTVTGGLDNGSDHHFLAGSVDALRAPEHGPARPLRLAPTDDFRESFVAVFEDAPTPADVARTVRDAGTLPIVFLGVVGSRPANSFEVQSMIETLSSCAAVTDRASARVVAAVPLAEGVAADLVLNLVLSTVNATQILRVAPSPTVGHGAGQPGAVILLSGLSGSGKSTIGRALSERLVLAGQPTVVLDGDDVRTNLSDGLTFSATDREKNLRRIGWVAAKIAAVGGIAICAPIAPFDSARKDMRRMAEETGRFVLVYVSTPLAVCEARDRKGLYALARAGELSDFTGINSPFEEPEDADVTTDTSQLSVDEAVDLILARAFPDDNAQSSRLARSPAGQELGR